MNERAHWIYWILATLIVAGVVHLASIYALPHFVMMRALTRLGTPNVMHFGRRPDANARVIVRPSPDLLYATCPYDLSKGPLRVTASVPQATYWSVSAFDSVTDNFFVRNDQTSGEVPQSANLPASPLAGKTIEILVLRHGQTLPQPGNVFESVILFSPSDRGLILFRTVIDDDRHVPALEAVLRQAHCETVASAKGLR